MIIPVKKLTIVVLKDYEEKILKDLGKLGVVELKKLSEGEVIGFREVVSEDVNKYMELLDRFKSLYNKVCANGCESLKIFQGEITAKVPYHDLDAKLKSHEMEIYGLGNQIKAKEDRREMLVKLRPIVEMLKKNGLKPGEIGEFKHIFSKIGIISEDKVINVEATLGGYEKIFYKIMDFKEGEKLFYVGGLIELKHDVEKFLERIGFNEITLPKEIPPDASESLQWIDEELNKTTEEIEILHDKLNEAKRKFLEEADYLRKAITVSYRIAWAQNNLLRSQLMAIISGWAPKDQIKTLNQYFQKVKEETGGKIIVTYSDPLSEEEIPTVYKNPKLFRAYETLIRQYGIPHPRETDPTILAGILWTIMFGYMFPDWGEGIVIIIMGVLFLTSSKKDLMGIPLKSVGRLLVGAGISATFFGLLTGSFFLIEGFPFEPLWPGLVPGWLERAGLNTLVIIWLLKIALYFGIIEITIGMLLNVYNNLRNKHTIEALLGEHGLAGLIGFHSLILIGFEFMAAMAAKDKNFTIIPKNEFIPIAINIPALGSGFLTYIPIITLVLSIIAIFSKAIIEGEGTTIGFSTVFESLLSFLTNFLSYARLAGFALAHVAFSVVVAKLAEELGLIGGVVGLVGLNFFALSLELVVVMIQALRLTFYEFLTKFYEGTGVPFKPFRMPAGT